MNTPVKRQGVRNTHSGLPYSSEWMNDYKRTFVFFFFFFWKKKIGGKKQSSWSYHSTKSEEKSPSKENIKRQPWMRITMGGEKKRRKVEIRIVCIHT